MGWNSLARKRSQVISVEGSSHVALLKNFTGEIALKTWGTFELRVCVVIRPACCLDCMSFWAILGKILLLLAPILLSMTALCKQELPGDACTCTDLQGCPLQPPESQFLRAVISMFLWTKIPTVYHKLSRGSQWARLVVRLPSTYLYHIPVVISCLAQRPEKTAWSVEEQASCKTRYFASSSSHFRGPIVMPL